jgi:16S rRNA (adenine1518-N6/adenine1519-N6)-dimethyltransferase
MQLHFPRKRFGQHFLHDQNVIQKIIAALQIKPIDHLVEIGPGLGALTKHLLPLVKQLEVVELDRDVIPELKNNCAGLGALIVQQADALRFDFTSLVTEKKLLRLIGNLPYNISTPLLFHLLSQAAVIQDMHFMLQKEVVDRIVAQPGQHAYGRLSVMVQYYCQTEALFTVKPGAFQPPPKIESAVLRIIPYNKPPYIAEEPKTFAEIVRLAFNQRRKTLRNSLHSLLTAVQWQVLGIDPGLRAEQLTVQQYVRIANLISSGE